jgi:crotonobetainyl-CoA:carnitine CoA-transferase CaiB-like acyl-CoA transferase
VTQEALLDGSRVLELATEIAGPYCGKMLADAGADVVKLEPPGGDPLRRWIASDYDLDGSDGALFKYLNASKRSIELGGPAAASRQLDELLPGCHLIIESGQLSPAELAAIRVDHPQLSVVSISSCGKSNPWSARPWTEFTLQAHSGSIAGRGDPDRVPFYAGGRLGEWGTGPYAAVAAVALLFQSHRHHRSDHADVSMLASMTMTMTSYRSLRKRLMARGTYDNSRSIDVPSIEPTKNGYIGFALATRQQFNDLLVMIERPDLIGDDDLALTIGRRRRRREFLGILHAWTTRHTSEEIIEFASAFRVPVAPISEPETILHLDHFVERGVFVRSADGSHTQPRPPFRLDDRPHPVVGPAPRLGEHAGTVSWPRLDTCGEPSGSRPLAGLRVVDLTAFWAGPSASQVLALLGADVIKVESVQRPDGMRFTGCRPRSEPHWWEHGYFFLALNTDKRGITLDLTSAAGRELLLDLLRHADVLMENFTPRVMDSFGLDRATLRATNPSLIITRMPGFGLDGPWRDRPGFAQNMEQASGMAWMTGYPDRPPCTVPGLCDPAAGMHGAFATIAALIERDRSGDGHLLESSMMEAALNLAPEMVLELTAYGKSLRRAGNRGPNAAPQGVYRAAGEEEVLVALAVTSDGQWDALLDLLRLGHLRSPAFSTDDGRRAGADLIDAELATAIARWSGSELADELVARGVPASLVVSGEDVMELEALRLNGFIEVFNHDVVGSHDVYVLPFRLAAVPEQWIRHAAPRLGQHNEDVLRDVLGLDDDTIKALSDSRVIGQRPSGA